ncbi:hypothetical protein LXL04_005004 [Taraxacum kok-saghyz]
MFSCVMCSCSRSSKPSLFPRRITALLLSISQVFSFKQQTSMPSFVFSSLLALDIASHWMQMYIMFMGYCCIACKLLKQPVNDHGNRRVIRVDYSQDASSLHASFNIHACPFPLRHKQSCSRIHSRLSLEP